MEDPESVASSGRGPVPIIELPNRGPRARDERFVLGEALRRSIRPVREERESQLRVRIGQVVHLQSLDRLADLGVVGQEHRNRDQSARLLRDAGLELELGQAPGSHEPRDEPLHERARQVRGGHGREDGEKDDGPGRSAGRRGERHRDGEDRGGPEPDRAEVQGCGRVQPGPLQPLPNGRPEAELRLEPRAPPGNEIVAGVGQARIGGLPGSGGGRPGALRQADGAPRHFELVLDGPPGELLHRVPIAVARRKVHLRDARAGAERFVNQAHALEEIRPVG